MEKQETMNILKRIKSHYQEFALDDFKVNEWHRELQKFDYVDVDLKLDEHLKSEVYGEQIPKLFFLTKHLIPTNEKGQIKKYVIRCQLCGADVPDAIYDKHFARCNATKNIVLDFKKYLNLNVDEEQLKKLNDAKFEEVYQNYLHRMLDAKIPVFKRKIILKILYPNREFDIKEMIKEMV